MNKPTAYRLYPEGLALLMAQPESTVYARANFATKHLWATQYAPDELYPAGDYPNQHEGWGGLPTWSKADRSLDGEDIVLWHTFGFTHVPRPEDWPVMPVDYAGFWLKPHGFLNQNPTMNMTAATGPDSCESGSTSDCNCDH